MKKSNQILEDYVAPNVIEKLFESAILKDDLEDLLNIDLNTQDIFSYDKNESDNEFEVNVQDTTEQCAEKIKSAIDCIIEIKEVENFVKSKSFINSIRYIIENKDKKKFENFHYNSKKVHLVNLIVEFIDLNFKYIEKELKKSYDNLLLNEQIEILKRLFILDYIIESFIEHFATFSYEFNLILIDNTSYINFTYELLSNKEFLKSIKDQQIIWDIFGSKTIYSIILVLQHLFYFFNHCKEKFKIFSPQILHSLALSFKEEYKISKWFSFLDIIPFAIYYEDENDEQTEQLLKEIFEKRSFENYVDILLKMSADEILKSRKALNILEIDYLNIFDIEKCNDDSFKKFIELSVNFCMHVYVTLIEDLKYFKPQKNKFQFVIYQIMSKIDALYTFTFLIQELTNRSAEFCIKFQKDNENSLKALLNFLTDEFILQMMINNKENMIIDLFLDLHYRTICSSILNLSKVSDKIKKNWININASKKLMDLSKRFQNFKPPYNEDFGLINIMTIGNVASDEDLNNFSVAPRLLASLIKRVEDLANGLEEKTSLIQRVKIEDNEIEHEFIVDSDGYNLFECLQAFYKYSINDKLKNSIYETFNIKPILKKVLINGNTSEQIYTYKLLNQLCFDKKIALDIGTDSETVNLMKDIQANSETVNKNLLKYVNGVMWLVNEENKERKTTTEELKHVFISYNAGSRKTCLQIKTFLESLGHKVWIDTEDIHGSSIDAMAKGIEASWCVLICMSSKYKESNNCRSEAEYVMQIKKPFIPLIMEKSYKPDGW